MDIFKNATNKKVIGEISPGYLSHERAPALIQKYLPHVKLIAILRNPVERAYSHFLFALQKGFEPDGVTFSEAIRINQVKLKDGFVRKRGYVKTGFYYKHLISHLNYFDRKNIKIFFFEDIQNNINQLLLELCEFLEIKKYKFRPLKLDYAQSGLPKNKIWHFLISKQYKWFKKLVKNTTFLTI